MKKIAYYIAKALLIIVGLPGLALIIIGFLTLTFWLILLGLVVLWCAGSFAEFIENYEHERQMEKDARQFAADVDEFGECEAHRLRNALPLLSAAEKRRELLRKGACPECEGLGYTEHYDDEGLDFFVFPNKITCWLCAGTGRRDKKGPDWQAREITAYKVQRDLNSAKHREWANQHNAAYFADKAGK